MADALTVRNRHEIQKDVAAAVASGEIHQLADGRAGVMVGLHAAASGDNRNFVTEGQFKVTKTASIVLLDGGRVYWDHSANTATFEAVDDRDFYLGTVVGDAAAADATVTVNLNVTPEYKIELGKGEWTVSDTDGLGTLVKIGGQAYRMEFDAIAEVGLASLLSDTSFVIAANAIAEFKINIVANGDDAALDINVGIANAGHATDADSITESCFIHVDGNVLNILAESDDGTIEVAATDTTVDYAEGTSIECWIDMRNPADIQIYVDGIHVLPSSVFRLDAATGPLKALIHMEKTSNNTLGTLDTEFFRVRTAEQ